MSQKLPFFCQSGGNFSPSCIQWHIFYFWSLKYEQRQLLHKLILSLQTYARCLRRPFCGIYNTYSYILHTGCSSEDDRKPKMKMTESLFYYIHAVPSTLAGYKSIISSVR